MKLILLVLAGWLIYYGFDGIRVNNSLVSYTAEQIKNEGIGNDRYIEITGCKTTGDFVTANQEGSSNTSKVVFGLMSSEDFESMIEDNGTGEIVVIVERNNKKFQPNCGQDVTCLDDLVNAQFKSDFSIKGVVQNSADAVSNEEINLLKDSNIILSPNTISIKEDSKPKGIFLSILMMIGGLILGALGLLSIFGGKNK